MAKPDLVETPMQASVPYSAPVNEAWMQPSVPPIPHSASANEAWMQPSVPPIPQLAPANEPWRSQIAPPAMAPPVLAPPAMAPPAMAPPAVNPSPARENISPAAQPVPFRENIPPPARPIQRREVLVIPQMPDANTGKIYQMQVGSFSTRETAAQCTRQLEESGFTVAQEMDGAAYRVSVTGIPAAMVRSAAIRLGALGITQIWIRE
jgi:hypothetical protein